MNTAQLKYCIMLFLDLSNSNTPDMNFSLNLRLILEISKLPVKLVINISRFNSHFQLRLSILLHFLRKNWKIFKYSKREKNIRVINNPGSGIVDALNFGIANSRNNWIARFDIDDLYSKERIEKQRKLISEGVAAIFCDYMFIDENGRSLGKVLSPVFNSVNIWSLINSQRTPHPGVIFSKSAFNSAGKYRTGDFPAEDISLWWRMTKYGKLISVPDILLFYRLHSSSVTATKNQAVNLKRREALKIYICKSENLFFNNFSSFYRKYLLLPDHNERQILAIRDYLAYLGYSGLIQKKIYYLVFFGLRLLFNPLKLQILIRLIFEKYKRSKYRFSYSKDK